MLADSFLRINKKEGSNHTDSWEVRSNRAQGLCPVHFSKPFLLGHAALLIINTDGLLNA